MSDQITQPQQEIRTENAGFPLGSIFILVALFAILFAQLSWVSVGDLPDPDVSIDGRDVAIALAGGAIAGLVFGLFIGLCHVKQPVGAIVGLGAGLLFGAMTGPICLVAQQAPGTACTFSLFGAAALIGIALIYRQINSTDPITRKWKFDSLTASTNDRDGS